jgi:hypothetical protein
MLRHYGAGTRIAPKHTVTQYVARTWSGKLTEQPPQWLNTAGILVFEPSIRAEHLMGKRPAPRSVVREGAALSGLARESWLMQQFQFGTASA